jgi:hypothetical protein
MRVRLRRAGPLTRALEGVLLDFVVDIGRDQSDAKSGHPRRYSLTTSRPPRCANCRRKVNPEFMQVVVDRKVWVLCGPPCEISWLNRRRGGRETPQAKATRAA